MELILIRHAQSENNARPEWLRTEDPGLTELGYQQAERLLAYRLDLFGAQLMITSPFRRALETARVLAGSGRIPVWVWRDVHEQGGCYSGYLPEQRVGRPGLTRHQIEQDYPSFVIDDSIDTEGWWGARPYETWQEAGLRARRVIDRLIGELTPFYQSVAVVTHADFMRLLLLSLSPLQLPVERISESILNTSVTILGVASPAVCRVWNSVEHLPPDMWSS